MKLTVLPGKPLRGTVAVPGDKSLSHRALLFAALADGESHIRNFLVSGVTRVMLNALSAVGVEWTLTGAKLIVQGRGLAGLRPPAQALDCGNSATTIRLLAGALAAAGIPAVLDGSAGLRKRPMERIVEPLQRMGVPIQASEGGGAPLTLAARLAGERLKPLVEDLPVASAQVKSCLLLAALAADGETVLREPGPSRDHTERMLSSMGATVTSLSNETVTPPLYETRLIPPAAPLQPLDINLPGDMSAAAFLIVAGTIVPESEIHIPSVEVNPTRTGLLDTLRAMGAKIEVSGLRDEGGEPVADLTIRAARLSATQVSGSLVVRMIDEFSVFGAAAAYAEGVTSVRDATELRYKESDRITTLCEELRALGVQAEEAPDGFTITGELPRSGASPVRGGTTHAKGDHRLAMAMSIAGLGAQEPVTVEGAEIIHESFPGFIETLRQLGADLVVEDALPV